MRPPRAGASTSSRRASFSDEPRPHHPTCGDRAMKARAPGGREDILERAECQPRLNGRMALSGSAGSNFLLHAGQTISGPSLGLWDASKTCAVLCTVGPTNETETIRPPSASPALQTRPTLRTAHLRNGQFHRTHAFRLRRSGVPPAFNGVGVAGNATNALSRVRTRNPSVTSV